MFFERLYTKMRLLECLLIRSQHKLVFVEPSFDFAIRFAIFALRTIALLEPERKNLPSWVLAIALYLVAFIHAN
jgi:tagatose-1,6-bisphosphate aldolase non-catalytic subunit AgaZ/GatZ